ncbi:nucleotide exchange factor GrpE [Saccharomonospora saliphila]|uniref:nucleotide exchange factor GrpE n=1 Tax=Saccharomonospora saliphila TaxID=369829 RepID=UPI00036FA5C3|nr:nucleotide exchange factor GrpE [Saccharomonospora saliphila]
MTERDDIEQAEQEPVVVRDRRKIDPETGELRREDGSEAPDAGAGTIVDEAGEVLAEAGTPGPSAGEGTVDEAVAPASEVERQLEERTADLQRVQAEYANYRRRVDRERESMADTGKASVVGDLLPLLDDLERAEAHGDLTGAFKAVADKLVGVLEKSGLESFGQEGEPFDPSVHEAVQHDTSPEVDGPTVSTVLRRGYRFGDRVLRAALVAVTDHEPAQATPGDGAGAGSADGPIDPPVGGELPVDTDENAR